MTRQNNPFRKKKIKVYPPDWLPSGRCCITLIQEAQEDDPYARGRVLAAGVLGSPLERKFCNVVKTLSKTS